MNQGGRGRLVHRTPPKSFPALAIWGVYNHKFSRGRLFLFGPGRARREQPNAGLHLAVRAFVRSVSHVKVLVASLFGLFLKFCVLHWNLGGCCRRKRTTPTAPHCAGPPPRTRAASHAANAHAPQPTHCVAASRGCGAVTPGLRGCRDRRGAFASPRRSPRVSCRLVVVVVLLGALRAAVALSLRVDRAPRARRPSAEHTRRGATDSALDVHPAHPASRAQPCGISTASGGGGIARIAHESECELRKLRDFPCGISGIARANTR